MRWIGDTPLAHELEREARAALDWIDGYGDFDGDGYVEYERKQATGLENQCWKDSHNSILFADGTQSSLPRACCEIQGYVYDAKLRCARLAREAWGDGELARRLEEEAAELKRRFNEDFWLADRGYFALALDGDKRPVDSLTSNIGHLLWSGIVDDDKAEQVARHLVGPRLFSGWGVRTMAEGDGGYNPIGYHLGTVWPHDNSLIAAGLARYGYRAEAARVALAMVEAAEYFDHRLPEAFAGYSRARTLFPVEYPTACSPQAWATGAPLLFVTTLLGLEPGDLERRDPVLPAGVGRLDLTMRRPGQNGRRRAARPRGVPRASGAGKQPPAVGSAREFFAVLAAHVDRADAGGTEGSFRFDVRGTGSWRLDVRGGDVVVTESEEHADLVVELTEQLLLAMARGEQNATTAFLTGSLKLVGDLSLAPKLERLLPQIPRA